MASVKTYSPKDVVVLLGGFYSVEGYASDTFINIKKDTKPFDAVKAMDGEQARIYRKDDGFTVELTLAQSAEANNILSALYNVDVATQMGKFPLFIKDLKGTTAFFAGTAWVEDIPDASFGSDLTTRTWTLGTADAALNVGGNQEHTSLAAILGLGSSVLPLLSEYGVI